MLRAVVDTNVWVSALLNPMGHPALVLEAFRNRRFVAILSPPLIEELIDVLSRPRIVEKYQLAHDGIGYLARARFSQLGPDRHTVTLTARGPLRRRAESEYLRRASAPPEEEGE